MNRAFQRGEGLSPSEADRSLVYNCTDMSVEWDPGKARLNARKHGFLFADAVAVLEDERALMTRDLFSREEQRWVTLGLDALGRVAAAREEADEK